MMKYARRRLLRDKSRSGDGERERERVYLGSKNCDSGAIRIRVKYINMCAKFDEVRLTVKFRPDVDVLLQSMSRNYLDSVRVVFRVK